METFKRVVFVTAALLCLGIAIKNFIENEWFRAVWYCLMVFWYSWLLRMSVLNERKCKQSYYTDFWEYTSGIVSYIEPGFAVSEILDEDEAEHKKWEAQC